MTRTFLILFSLVLLPSSSFAVDPTWKAGFAKVAITPDQPMWMSGYASRTSPAEGKETELWAKAMVLQPNDGPKIVLVSLDLVGIDREESQRICKGIQESQKVNRDSICLSVSHTHCGPVLGSTLRTMYFLDAEQSRRVNEYAEKLPGMVVKAVENAAGAMEPVTLSWGVGKAGFAVNRRENKEAEIMKIRQENRIKGPDDHEVPVLAARNAKGELKGIVFGYACHATVLGFQKWCGDYPGFAMMELEASYPGAVAMFFAGCGADQNPLPRRTVELARGYGKQLATAVDAVLAKPMQSLTSQARATYKEIDLPLAELPTREALIKDTMDSNKYVAARAKMLLEKLAKGEVLPSTYPYPVQSWRLGKDLTLITLGGEVVVDYSNRLKKELGQGKTWVMGYANDVMAYIPSLRVLKEGGYEGASSMIYYGLPTTWGPKVEEAIVAECRKQALMVRGK